MPLENPNMYNAPNTNPSTVGTQIRLDYYYRKALVEAAKEQYFGQMADVRSMPKNMGKTIKQYHYLPILDDRNINDQGIDADGVSKATNALNAKTVVKTTVSLQAPLAGLPANLTGKHPYLPEKVFFEGVKEVAADGTAGVTAAAAIAEDIAKASAYDWLKANFNVTDADFAAWETANGQATTGTDNSKWTVEVIPDTVGDINVNYGNLYGSSKDVGTIASKIPVLSETGGRVNRVGMKRIELEGTLEKFGFFEEYTQESLDFDTDAELMSHITTEAVKAANEITEDQLQIDLLNSAGVVRYTGTAVTVDGLDGDTDGATVPRANDVVTYDDLVKLAIELDNNRTPKNTRLITGSRMIDTRVVNAARYMYVGSEMLPTLMRMTDYHGEKAWIPVAQYGAATTLARGEVGAIHDFRVIVVPEMMHWEAAGGTATPANALAHYGHDDAGDVKYNVYPMLVVGDQSFTTIGFQTDGKTVKFKITHKPPGKEIADRNDPYGEVGFYSIKWYYGFMVLRPERIAIIKTIAEY